jgi:hypothetical protein
VSAIAVGTPAAKRARKTRLERIVRAPRFARLLSLITFLVVWQVSIPLLPTLLVPTPAEVGEFMWNEIRGQVSRQREGPAPARSPIGRRARQPVPP